MLERAPQRSSPASTRSMGDGGVSKLACGAVAMSTVCAARRLLFIVNVDWFFISHRLPVALAAKANGFDVHVATAFEAATRAKVDAMGLNAHSVPFSRCGSRPLALLKELAHVVRLLRTVRPEVLHLVTLKPVLLGGFAA